EGVKVSQNELTQYLIQGASQYNMDPSEFIQVLDQNGQIAGMIAEVARNKALATVLGKAKVVDGNGKTVDLTDFVATDDAEGDDFVEAIAPERAAQSSNVKDSHGRSPGHEHYGHDHK